MDRFRTTKSAKMADSEGEHSSSGAGVAPEGNNQFLGRKGQRRKAKDRPLRAVALARAGLSKDRRRSRSPKVGKVAPAGRKPTGEAPTVTVLPSDDDLDTRFVLQAFGRDIEDSEDGGEEVAVPMEWPATEALISAPAGFSLLECWWWQKELQCSQHPIIAWRLFVDGGVLPISFGVELHYQKMCNLAVKSPTGIINGFDGGSFADTKAWFENRKIELRGSKR